MLVTYYYLSDTIINNVLRTKMSNDLWKEFKGWWRSFTKLEAALAVVEGVLLVLLISFLLFFILHMAACKKYREAEQIFTTTIKPIDVTKKSKNSESHTAIECTWKPSQKTTAGRQYFIYNHTSSLTSITSTTSNTTSLATSKTPTSKQSRTPAKDIDGLDQFIIDDESDEESYDSVFILALVKMSAQEELIFGCTLTAISEYWTLTAASCVQALEDFKSFVMVEHPQTGRSVAHVPAAVRAHPQSAGANRSYDVAAVRSQDRLSVAPVTLPTPLDYFLTTIGERFTVLGFGSFRSSEHATSAHAPHHSHVYRLPCGACAGGAECRLEGARRHLVPLGRGGAGGCGGGGGPFCAGVLDRRGDTCHYCAGTPLLRGSTLVGVLSARSCRVSCGAARYVTVPVTVTRGWIDTVLDTDRYQTPPHR